MDNLTHTLVGLAAGEAIARCTRPGAGGLPESVRRTWLLVIAMVGGNLPDADLLWSMQIATSDRLTYLVEHRGYTHTLLGCAVLALLLVIGAVATLRWRGHRVRASEAWLFAATAALAVLLHLGMDALNEYGVHPFWPWNNRWYYGDSVFIVEPLCWIALAPVYFSLRSRAARGFLAFVLVAGCGAVLAFHGFGAPWWGLPAVTVLLLWLGHRLSQRMSALVAVSLLCAVVGGFLVAHGTALRRIEGLAARMFPGARVLDVVLSPAAAHPFCWDVMLLQQQGSDYIARLGQLSLIPDAAVPCARSVGEGGTAPLRAMHRPIVSGMRWTGEYTMDIQALARLAGSDCDTRRLASFLRAPFAARSDKGWIIGDLRYDRESGMGFTEWLVDPKAGTNCPNPSPWTPPRRDLGFQ